MKKLFYCFAFVSLVAITVLSLNLNKNTNLESILSSNIEALTTPDGPDGDGTPGYWRWVYPYNSTGHDKDYVSTWRNKNTGEVDNVGGYPVSDWELLGKGNACKVYDKVNLVADGKCWPNI